MIRDIADRDAARCPENKVTDELASDPRLGLHPIAIAIDECQKGFEHPLYGKEIEAICEDIVRRGPAVGMLILLATQRPDAASVPPNISANAVLRWCLKVIGQVANDMVMGTSAHRTGIRATMFGFDDKGVCYFGGEGSGPRSCAPSTSTARPRRSSPPAPGGCASGQAGSPGTRSARSWSGHARSFAADVLEVFGDRQEPLVRDDRRPAPQGVSRGVRGHHARTPWRASSAPWASRSRTSGRPAASPDRDARGHPSRR